MRPFSSPELKAKAEVTMLEKHGSTSFLGTRECIEKTKQHYQKTFGADHPMHVPEIVQKMHQTNIARYGNKYGRVFGSDSYRAGMLRKHDVEYPAQSIEIQHKQKSRYSFDGQQFDSSLELAFYIYLSDKKIPFRHQPGCSLWYSYVIDGKQKRSRYFPDFEVDGQLIEIKGRHLMSADGQKWICPYRHASWSDKRWEEECSKYEAKHQCAFANNVKILTDADCQKYVSYVNEAYGIGHLMSFKNVK